MCGDSIRGLLGLVFSILLVCGIFYGCGSWYSYLDEKHSREAAKKRNEYESKLPEPYRKFVEEFYKDTGELLDYSIRNLSHFHFDILLRNDRKQIWEKWNAGFKDYLLKKENILSKFSDRLNSVNNPPEGEFMFNSYILDNFSWEIECDKIRLNAIEKLYNLYDLNECCWTVQNGKVTYFDESFRKKAEVEKFKYYRLCDRLEKSQKDDL